MNGYKNTTIKNRGTIAITFSTGRPGTRTNKKGDCASEGSKHRSRESPGTDGYRDHVARSTLPCTPQGSLEELTTQVTEGADVTAPHAPTVFATK